METGYILQRNVHIKDSIIARIENSSSPVSKSALEVIDGSSKYLIPGLWDMHVHIRDSLYLAYFLDHGIVGVRDMGGCSNIPSNGCESVCPEQLYRWKMAIAKGEFQGPHLFFAGPTLSGTGWPTSLPVNTIDQVQKAFQVNLGNKVDFIKVYEQIPRNSYGEIARLSRSNHLDFVGHTSETLLLSEIVELGQKSIEHLREPILYCFTDSSEEMEAFMVADGYSQADRELVAPWINDADKAIASMKERGTWFTPTMAIQYARQRFADSFWLNHELRKKMPLSVNKGLYKHMGLMRLNEDKKGDSLWWMAHKKLVKRFNKEGIGLLAGSDSACEGTLPGFSLHEELFLMVDAAGLSPLEALKTATVNPCRYFGFEDRGKIEESHYADLVLLSSNPLVDIRNTLSIETVIRNGKPVRSN